MSPVFLQASLSAICETSSQQRACLNAILLTLGGTKGTLSSLSVKFCLQPEMMPGLGASGDAISSEGESMQGADLEGDSSDDEEQCWCTRCTHYTLTTHCKARHDRIQNLSEAQFQAAAEAARNQELSRRAAKTGAKPATGFQPGFFKPQPERPGEASGKAAPGSSAQAESDEDMPELIVTDDSEAESGSAQRKPAVKPAAKQKAKPEAKPPTKPEANGIADS